MIFEGLKLTLLGMGVTPEAVRAINSRLGGDENVAFPLDTKGRKFHAVVGGVRVVMVKMYLCIAARKDKLFSGSVVGEVVEEQTGV